MFIRCVSLVIELTWHVVVREGNKKGVFALKNVGVVDFVVWIFFCKFVDCV